MKMVAKIIVLVVVFVLTIYVTSYISRLPESNCTTKPIGSQWSGDRTYKSTLLKKDCNSGETTFYSVRIDKQTTASDRGWSLVEDLEADPYPEDSAVPTMNWYPHRLEISVRAKTLSGSVTYRLEPHEGDLAIVRTYSGNTSAAQ
jgi:hypothetical protein